MTCAAEGRPSFAVARRPGAIRPTISGSSGAAGTPSDLPAAKLAACAVSDSGCMRGAASNRALEQPIAESHRAAPDLHQREFKIIQCFAIRSAGISIADFKRTMVRNRLLKRLRALGLDSFAAYCSLLDSAAAKGELQQFINALTTNKTEFFREEHHFADLLDRIPARTRGTGTGPKKLRIWSAGCSTGEEPYSIAMSLLDRLPEPGGWDIKILATDIDTDVLARAEKGIYSEADVQRIPLDLRHRFFERVAGERGRLRVGREARSLVVFKPLNLMEDWPMRHEFDAVFCRNVIIYFDRPTQRSLLHRFADAVRLGGHFYCGHSESLVGVTARFRPIGRCVYERVQ